MSRFDENARDRCIRAANAAIDTIYSSLGIPQGPRPSDDEMVQLLMASSAIFASLCRVSGIPLPIAMGLVLEQDARYAASEREGRDS